MTAYLSGCVLPVFGASQETLTPLPEFVTDMFLGSPMVGGTVVVVVLVLVVLVLVVVVLGTDVGSVLVETRYEVPYHALGLPQQTPALSR